MAVVGDRAFRVNNIVPLNSMLPIIHWVEIVVGVTITTLGFFFLDRTSRIPYGIYFLFYVVTCLIGGLAIFFIQDNVTLWNTIFFKIEASALPSPLPERYFQLLVMPLLIVPATVISLYLIFPVKRQVDIVVVRLNRDEVGAIILISGIALIFCISEFIYNGISLTGYLSAAQPYLDYTGKMLVRVSAFSNISVVSTAIIYTALPMFVAGLAVSTNFMPARQRMRRVVISISAFILIADLYLCTLIYIKSQIIISMIYVMIAIIMIRKVKFRHVVVTSAIGVLLLGVLYYFLSFSSGRLSEEIALRIALLTAVYQIFFRMSTGLPFYASLFPDVQPHPGIFLGPHFLGLAPKFATNNMVSNYEALWADPAVQGQVPAPAHFSAYAGSGILWAAVSLVLIGVIIFAVGRLGRNVRTALGVGLFVVWCIYIYYTTQGDLIGGLWASYGPAFGVFFYYICRGVQVVIRAARRRSLPVGVPESDV